MKVLLDLFVQLMWREQCLGKKCNNAGFIKQEYILGVGLGTVACTL